MSRIDDELRIAFRREQPPADFLARVLERAALQPEPRPSWWQRLAMLLGTPRLRWVAIGATALLLLAVGAVQYGRLRGAVTEDHGRVAVVPPHSEAGERDAASPAVDGSQDGGARSISTPPELLKRHRASTSQVKAPAHDDRQRVTIAEARAAKEKLMLALYIASATLNDAEKAVHDDSPKP